MKLKKTHLAFFLLLITWTFLPSTFFISEKTKVFDIVSPDKQYKVNVYHAKIISPLSFYKYLKDEDYYFVLYDFNGVEVFKPSLFYGMSEISAYDSIEFSYGKDKELLFPGKSGYNGFNLK